MNNLQNRHGIKRGINVGGVSAKASRHNMARFLKEMGAPKGKIDDAVKKLDTGEIQTSGKSFDWITPRTLYNSDFNLKQTMKDIKEARKNSVNFKVSDETLKKRMRNG